MAPCTAALLMLAADDVYSSKDPIQFFAQLGQLPVDQQDVILREAGKLLMKREPDIVRGPCFCACKVSTSIRTWFSTCSYVGAVCQQTTT